MRYLAPLALLVACSTGGSSIPDDTGGTGGASGSSGGAGTKGASGTAGSGGTGGSNGTGGTGGSSGSSGSSGTAGTSGASSGTAGTSGEGGSSGSSGTGGASGSSGSSGTAGAAATGAACGDGPQEPQQIVSMDYCNGQNGPQDLDANNSAAICPGSCGFAPYAFSCSYEHVAPGNDCTTSALGGYYSCCETPKCRLTPGGCGSNPMPNGELCHVGVLPSSSDCQNMGEVAGIVSWCCP